MTVTDFIDSASKGAANVITATRKPNTADAVNTANTSAAAKTAVTNTNWTPWIIVGAVVIGALLLFGVLRK